MKENNIMSLYEFEDKCKERNYISYIFTDKKQNQNNYNIRLVLMFNSLKIYYDNIYNTVFLGDKNNCVELKRVEKVEECEKFDNCTKYKIYCKNKPFRKARVFTILAVEPK